MTPDDMAALAELEGQLEKLPPNGPAAGSFFAPRIPWLVSLVRRQQARIAQLESGGIPEVVAAWDAELAARDAQLATAAARIAEVEAIKLPDPNVEFRRKEPRIAPESATDSLSDDETLAVPSDR